MEYKFNQNKKTVFFGPFFGEFGWELSYWHGWVKKMCREKYHSFRKIAASYPGREPFYPDADEFWPHPLKIAALKISQRGYITDYWRKNMFKGDSSTDSDRDIGRHADDLLEKYKEKLPKNTIFFVPHKLNFYQLNGKKNFFGPIFLKGKIFYTCPKVLNPKIEDQTFEKLEPTPEGRDFFKKITDFDKRIIAVFPRRRLVRRSDKNWPKEKYDLLIRNLQKRYPGHLIGIFGAPGGAYFTDGVPAGCLDFINLPEEIRFSVQLAALEQSVLAVGSLSGAMRVAALAGCPLVEWGFEIEEKSARRQNFLGTKINFWPEMNPSVENIENIIDLALQNKEEKIVYPESLGESADEVDEAPFILKKIDFLRIALREIITRLLLRYLKNRNLKEGLINNVLLEQ